MWSFVFFIPVLTSTYLLILCSSAALTKETSSYSEMVSPDQIDTMIKDKLNVLTGLKMTGIKQKKSKTGAPSYYNKTTLLTSSCSISHHGKYGAYSFVKA